MILIPREVSVDVVLVFVLIVKIGKSYVVTTLTLLFRQCCFSPNCGVRRVHLED